MAAAAHTLRTDVGALGSVGTSAGRRSTGVAMGLGSAVASQGGAAVGALAFPDLGALGVVAVRQWVGGLLLLALGRPDLRSFTRAQWTPVLLLAGIFAAMNLSLYSAIERIGLGLAVTLEFLGPLAVALAASRRAPDVLYALVAAGGVAVIARPQPTTDRLGIALGVVAGACWAGYILLNRVVGRRLPGAEGTAAAAGISALLYLPVGLALLVGSDVPARALLCAAVAGLLSTATPFLLDMLALRRVPAGSFGLLMSVHPVLAACFGTLVLHQALGAPDWLAIGAIVAVNVASAASYRPGVRRSARGAARAGRG